MNRVNKNLRWIERQLAKAGEHNTLETEILDALNATEVDLCQEWCAIKGTATITFVEDQEEYNLPSGTYQILAVDEPSTWTKRLKFTSNSKEYVDFKKRITLGTQPYLALFFENKLWFHPAPTATDEITLFLIKVPEVPMKEDGDPTLPEEFDYALRYGALARLIGGDWHTMYEAEAVKRGTRLTGQQVNTEQVEHSSRRLGF